MCVGSVLCKRRGIFWVFFFCFLAKGFLRQLGDGGARVKRRVCVAARATWVRASSVGSASIVDVCGSGFIGL